MLASDTSREKFAFLTTKYGNIAELKHFLFFCRVQGARVHESILLKESL